MPVEQSLMADPRRSELPADWEPLLPFGPVEMQNANRLEPVSMHAEPVSFESSPIESNGSETTPIDVSHATVEHSGLVQAEALQGKCTRPRGLMRIYLIQRGHSRHRRMLKSRMLKSQMLKSQMLNSRMFELSDVELSDVELSDVELSDVELSMLNSQT